MNRNKLAFMFAAVIFIAVMAWLLFGRQPQPAQIGVELLDNSGFDTVNQESLPEGWLPEAYVNDPDITEFSVSTGKSGQAVRIVNHSPNDARFFQSVKVNPETLYRFSGYIRAEAIGGRGANLSVADIYVFSEPVFQTAGGWENVELYGMTGTKQHEVTLFVRLGGYSGESEGTAEFDELSLMALSEAPEGVVIGSWDKSQYADSIVSNDKGEAAAPAAPWLLALMVLGVLLLIFIARAAENGQERELAQKGKANHWELLSLLLLALLTRLLLAWKVPGFPVDIACFTAWANLMAELGPARFYISGSFSDYPPGYMLVLWPLGLTGRALGTGATEFMVKFPPVLFDLGIIFLLYRVAAKRVSHRSALLLSALYAFNPLPYLTGATWGQADSVPSLLLLAAVLLIIGKRWRWALPVYVLAVLMKPQALMAGPLGLLALVMDFVWRRDKGKWRDFFIGVGLSLAVAAAVVLPFFNEQNGFSWLISLYGNTMGYYSYASVNATNLFFLFGKNWSGIADTAPFLLRLSGLMVLLLPAALMHFQKSKSNGVLEGNVWKNTLPLALVLLPALIVLAPMSLSLTGTLLMVSAFLLVTRLYITGKNTQNLPLLAGVLLALFSILGTMMHERYLFLAAVLLTLAYVIRRDRRLLVLLLCVSALCFLNSGVALDRGVRIGGGAGNLSAPEASLVSDSGWLEYALSAFSLPVSGYALYLGIVLTRPGSVLKPVESLCLRKGRENKDRFEFLRRQPRQIRFGRRDAWIIIAVTALYAILALVNLGSLDAPQTAWVSGGGNSSATLDLGGPRSFRVLFYAGIHWQDSGFTLETSADGEEWTAYPGQVKYGDCFAWRYLNQAYQSPDGSTSYYSYPQELEGRYVRLTAPGAKLTLFELVAQDAQTGANLPLAVITPDAKALADEMDTLKGGPTWFNSMYFDEIYHARTAFEQRNALTGEEPSAIYETSHPPLGKVLMTFSVMVFGMNPFGWRFAGALAGVLMLPGLYLLGKQLTGRKRFGLFAMLLMAFDFMHFTQTRIATIDSFATLFIIYSYFFMFRWMGMDYVSLPLKKSLPPLFLSGLMMGFAIASKWTGIYAGLGLAALFFCTVAKAMLNGMACKKTAEQETDSLGDTATAAGIFRDQWKKKTVAACLWCVVFFIAVPAVIYYLSYIPVFISTPGGLTVQKVINANTGMYDYHSSKGLGADHPFSSPWYEWPLIIKPMYYYAGGIVDGTASTILSFGNPLVWWGGLLALLFVVLILIWQAFSSLGLVKPLVEKCQLFQPWDSRPLMLLVAFAAQYLPWILVPRGTYIYHYFPSVPFIILCMTLLTSCLMEKSRKAAHILLIALPVMALLLFISFFPYLSGVRVSTAWLDVMKWFPNWLYY